MIRWTDRSTTATSVMVGMAITLGMASVILGLWGRDPAYAQVQYSNGSLSTIFDPDSEDIPFFQAIAQSQNRELKACKTPLACQKPHFLRGLALLYSDKALASSHFRQVVAAKPSSRLAAESRFWLWLLDVLGTQKQETRLTLLDLARRLTREIVDREFMVYDLVAKLEQTSLESLQQQVIERDQKVEELNQVIASLTTEISELEKEPAIRLSLQKELHSSEKKVEELMHQLEALRRIDQELKEKTPPTRPSEELTPSPELETASPN
ncbi:MAG: hypothetical protein NPIRA02_25680 [Nitrospirales bacterium]|nr:MAG: hypothetical protein NPIRA02_25680 [Nitrospirales bacterium]